MPHLFSPKLRSGSGNGVDHFQDLLCKLQEEHERQLESLQHQVHVLQSQCGLSDGLPTWHNGERPQGPLARSHTTFVGSGVEHQEARFTRTDTLASSASKGSPAPALDPDAIPLTFSADDDGGAVGRTGSHSEVLELKGMWKDLIKQYSQGEFNQLVPNKFDFDTEHTEEKSEQKEEAGVVSCFLKLCLYGVVSPNMTWRLYWECMGLVLVCFDMINIPLSTVYDLPDNFFSATMDWATLLFWTADMAQSFFVGYYDKGRLVMKQPAVVINYLKTWFAVDILVVLPDWFLTIAGSGSQAGDLSRLLRTSRAIRVLRLLRVMKLQRVINKLYDMIDNEYSFILAELVKMMLVILVLNHVIACGWFGVGKLCANSGKGSWVNWSENFLDDSVGYQYATSLHWTLTQFTPASMDVVARNIAERVYSIVVLLFAMVAFSSIVGTVTSSMTVIRQMKNDKQKQFWMLRRYLKQKSVSMDLTMRMTRFLEFQMQKQQKLIQAGKVIFLNQISDQLSRELAYEMFEPCLKKHAFFRFLSKEMKGVAARICQMALRAMQVATDDTIFAPDEDANRSFIIKSGDLGYMRPNGSPLLPAPREKEWLAEAAIWTPWRYRGRLFAFKPSDLLSVEAARFAEAMSIHPKPVSIARAYGQKFVSFLNSVPPSHWTDVLRDEEFYTGAVFEVGKHASEESLPAMDDGPVDPLGKYNPEDSGDSRHERNVVVGREEERAQAERKRSGSASRSSAPWAGRGGGCLARGGFLAGGCLPVRAPEVHAAPVGKSCAGTAMW